MNLSTIFLGPSSCGHFPQRYSVVSTFKGTDAKELATDDDRVWAGSRMSTICEVEDTINYLDLGTWPVSFCSWCTLWESLSNHCYSHKTYSPLASETTLHFQGQSFPTHFIIANDRCPIWALISCNDTTSSSTSWGPSPRRPTLTHHPLLRGMYIAKVKLNVYPLDCWLDACSLLNEFLAVSNPLFTAKMPAHGIPHHITTTGFLVWNHPERLNPAKLA